MAGISPEDTFTYWIVADRDKPEGERRGLVYRHGTAGDWRRFTADKRKAEELRGEDYFDAVLDLCKRGLQSWIGFDRAYDGCVEELLMEGELIEIVDELRFSSTLSELEKKRLSRQSKLLAEPSVNGVAAASAPK